MAFDTQKYLATKASQTPVTSVAKGFDPQLYLQNVGGNIITSDVPTVAGQVPNPPVIEQKRTMMDYVKSLYEVPATMVTGAAAPFLGVGAGAIENIRQGTSKRVDSPEFAQRFQYQPTSPVSQDILQSIGGAFEASKLPPVLPTGMLPSYARMVQATPPQVRQMGQTVQEAGPRIAQALRQPQPTMSGVGAAETPEAVTRTQMATQLRVPVYPSKGQATRDLAQQQFEIETAKNFPETVGKPLIKATNRSVELGFVSNNLLIAPMFSN